MEPRPSPDGSRLVYVERRCDLGRNRDLHVLRLLDLGSGAGRDLTRGEHSDTSPCWTPDGRAVVFVSDRGGSENLWRIRLDQRVPERLTMLDGIVREPRVAPDGRHVAFLHAAPGSRRGRGSAGRAWYHLWVLDLATRRVRQVTAGEGDDGQHDWSPDGRRLVFVAHRPRSAGAERAHADLYVVRARGGRPRRLTHSPGSKQSPAWSPDGRRIAFLGPGRSRVESPRVWTVPASGGPARDLLGDADLMCGDALLSDVRPQGGAAPRPAWAAGGDRIFFLATRRGTTDVWEIDARGGRPRQRSFGRHHLTDFAPSADGRTWAFVRLTTTEPGDVWVATMRGGNLEGRANGRPSGEREAPRVPGARLRRLTRLNGALMARCRPAVAEELLAACHGGHEVHGWMIRSPSAPRRGPVVLVARGTAYAAFGWSFCFEFQLLAARGYHVVYTNPRGSAGYGRDFMDGLVGRWGIADLEDLTAVTDAVEKLPGVDPARIGLAGEAYGGYLTSWMLAHTRRYRCGISSGGAANLVSMFGTSDVGPDLVHEFEGQLPWESAERWWRVSPLAFVRDLRTPLLLLHAEDDRRFPVSQSEELFTALRVLDRDVEFVRFAGEDHGMPRSGRPRDRIERLRRILDWLDRKL
jgi:dipeptidyl aminopeptidase/acylaminoacyl peptidase